MSDLSFVAGEFPRLASTAREAAEAVRSARPEGGAGAFASAMPGTNLSSKMQGVEDKFADQATKTGTSLDEHAESLLAAERDFIAAEEENTKLIGSIIEGHSYGGGAAAGASEIIGGHSKGSGLTGHSIGGQGDINTIGGEPLTGHSKGSGLTGHSIGGQGDINTIGGEPLTGHSKGSGLTGHSIGGKGDINTIGGEPLTGHSYGSAGAEAGDVDDMVTFGEPGKGRGGLRPGDKDWIDRNPIAGPVPQPKIPEPVKDFVNDAVEGVKETARGVAEELGKLDPSLIGGPFMPDPDWLDDVKRK